MNSELIEAALSVYGSNYKEEFSAGCDVEIPENANWCGVFCGYLLSELGHKLPPNPQVARSYLKIGEPVDEPAIGDLVVFWRGRGRTDWRGHVSIFIREVDNWIYCLGGNQQGKVQIVRYRKNRLLGYRRISTVQKSAL